MSGRSTDQLAEYRAHTESYLARTREEIANIADLLLHRESAHSGRASGSEEQFQAFLRTKSNDELIAQKRQFERRLIDEEQVLALAVRVLEARLAS